MKRSLSQLGTWPGGLCSQEFRPWEIQKLELSWSQFPDGSAQNACLPQEMPVLRGFYLGWEGSWPSAWCWEWAVPTSKAAFGLPVTWDFLGRICYPQAPWPLGSLSTCWDLSADRKDYNQVCIQKVVSLSSASVQSLSLLPTHKAHLLLYLFIIPFYPWAQFLPPFLLDATRGIHSTVFDVLPCICVKHVCFHGYVSWTNIRGPVLINLILLLTLSFT